jgi:hypothetical protein
MTQAHIIGWGHTVFGKSDHPDTESLMAQAVAQALAHAEIAPADVDGIFVGVFNNGFSKQDFQGALVAMGDAACPCARHTVRECLRHRLCRAAWRDGFHRRRARAHRPCGRRGKDDSHPDGRGGRYPAFRQLPQARRPRSMAALPASVRPDRPKLFPALWRPFGRTGHDRGQEPREWHGQPLSPICARISGWSSATRLRQKPLCRWPACGAPIARLCLTARRCWCWPIPRRPHRPRAP